MLKIKRNWNTFITFLHQNLYRRIASSIRYKLMVLMLVVMIVPLLLLIIFAINVSQSTFEREIVNSNHSRIVLAGKYVNEKVRQSDKLLYASLVDEKLVPSISDTKRDLSLQYNAWDYIEDKLFSFYYGTEHIGAISLYSKENHTVYSLRDDSYFVDEIDDTTGSKWAHLAPNSSYRFTNDEVKQSFTLTRSIIRFEDRKIVGGISVEMKWSLIDSVIDMLESEKESSVFLLNRSGHIMYNPNQVEKPPVDFEKVIKQINSSKNHTSYLKTKKAYIFFQKAVNNEVIVVKVIPNKVVLSGSIKTLTYGIIISIFSIILTVGLSIAISLRTTKPIIELARAMQEVEDHNLDVKVEVHSRDEIGLLEKRFTSMIHRIKELIEREYKNEVEKRSAQFMALQAQVNPHFLYNTLQLVGGMAVAHNVPKIYSVVSALSDMFRYITRKHGNLVWIEQEMEHIKNYLYIQELRFEGKIETEIFIEDGVEHDYIPMLSIQPIVENAFKHGFEKKTGVWKLSIEVQKVFGDIEIVIKDNGVGIEAERLQEIKGQLQSNIDYPLEAKGSIGVKNVDARIKLSFGNDYGLDITSEPGQGTQILMRIPTTKTLEG
ncbi:sensor histidine kinase [Ectobacillus funiculus]|uniref:Histidine kinase n=1 Tax=Ectobacillus funiculus TaxID=137993 RepID=A0ABV5WDQ2_9BACI